MTTQQTLLANELATKSETAAVDSVIAAFEALPEKVAEAANVKPDTPQDELPDDLLLTILQTKRAHTSAGDTNFRLWLTAEIKKLGFTPDIAVGGSIVVTVDKKSTTLFSCHIDTVHSVAESNGSRQKLMFDPAFGHIFLQDPASSGCLGGDDGVGVYIMLKMLAAKVKGSYLFHTGEERGGIGARAVLGSRKKWLEGFERCIAFDRAVKHGESPEVIVTQGGQACASVAFGNQLKDALNKFEFDDSWVVSHGGSFTDSKVYSGVISECVNLGCFYVNQHSSKEVVDAYGVEKLLHAALNIDWKALKSIRKPEEEVSRYGGRDFHSSAGYGGNARSWAGRDSFDGFDDFPRDSDLVFAGGKPKADNRYQSPQLPHVPAKLSSIATTKSMYEELLDYTKDEIIEFVDMESTVVVDMMCLLIARNRALEVQVETLEAYFGA